MIVDRNKMQNQTQEDEISRTIYTITFTKDLYEALKRITKKNGNLYVGTTIVQLLEENPKVKKELKERSILV